MKIRSSLICGILVTFLFTFQNKVIAFQNEPDGFKGIKWGTKVEVIDGLSFFEKGENVTFYRRLSEKKKIDTIALSDLLYGFTNDRFSDVFLIIAPKADKVKERLQASDNFESLKDILFQKHGTPKNKHLADPLKGERFDNYKWIGSNVCISLNFDLPSKVTILKYWYIPLHNAELSFPSWELYTRGKTFSVDLKFYLPLSIQER